ncbi:hypothetical protein Y032_0152g2874 [Ancylostoma ceylanicum]|uniref:Uncharacterized protein n=1 Tax=Ancylostoma ceylanicum TaxID=53326 RepID=A0A016T0K3_9BILA|nr:hypothetical protein Y032_0152g2874 [Ancylostoma ceylanicum]
MVRANEKLKLWRKLSREQHPLLKQFKQHIMDALLGFSTAPSAPCYRAERFTTGRRGYVKLVERFMLPVKRSRRRFAVKLTVGLAGRKLALRCPHDEKPVLEF